MASEILVNAGAGETRVAWIVDGVLQGYAAEPAFGHGVQVGDIILGRVTRVMPAMQAAFVAIGEERDGFLSLRDSDTSVHEGAAMVVRVTREPLGEKGAKLTGRVTLTPELETRSRIAKPPALLMPGPGIVERCLGAWKDGAILVDDARMAKDLAAKFPDREIAAVREDLFARHDLEDQVALLWQRRVPLPCGGWITIEKTEGLTAIDVNSGSFAASGGRGDTARLVNQEAARAAGRHIRLRGIGGSIVVDFIQMETGWDALTRALSEELGRDTARFEIAPMAFGLVAIARQRQAAPPAPPTTAQAILRAVERAARGAPGRAITVRASQSAAGWLATHDTAVRAGLDRRGVGRMTVIGEAGEGFDVAT